MKTPSPDFNKDTVTLSDIVDWINQGFRVKTQTTIKDGIRYGAYWDGKCIVVYEQGELRAE